MELDLFSWCQPEWRDFLKEMTDRKSEFAAREVQSKAEMRSDGKADMLWFPVEADFAAAKVAVFGASILSAVIGTALLWPATPEADKDEPEPA